MNKTEQSVIVLLFLMPGHHCPSSTGLWLKHGKTPEFISSSAPIAVRLIQARLMLLWNMSQPGYLLFPFDASHC
jgi:hypothetical protein